MLVHCLLLHLTDDVNVEETMWIAKLLVIVSPLGQVPSFINTLYGHSEVLVPIKGKKQFPGIHVLLISLGPVCVISLYP